MKHIKLIALAASIITLNSGNAVADETVFKSPDISGKLNVMVEEKMDRLVKKTYERREYVRVAEYENNNVSVIPGSCGKEIVYVSKEIGS